MPARTPEGLRSRRTDYKVGFHVESSVDQLPLLL